MGGMVISSQFVQAARFVVLWQRSGQRVYGCCPHSGVFFLLAHAESIRVAARETVPENVYSIVPITTVRSSDAGAPPVN